MLPLRLLSGGLEARFVELRKIARDDAKEVDAEYFALFSGRSVIFERKHIPSPIAADNTIVVVECVDHVRIVVVLWWPAKNH